MSDDEESQHLQLRSAKCDRFCTAKSGEEAGALTAERGIELDDDFEDDEC